MSSANHMKKILIAVFAIAIVCIGLTQKRQAPASHSPSPVAVTESVSKSTDAEFAKARDTKASGIQLQGEGTVKKLLPDDTKGIRHQKFIVKLQSGQSLLFAHNIDISSRISSLREGDAISFKGEYEWTPQGGVIHWTHHDPSGRHPAGWLKHGKQAYQ